MKNLLKSTSCILELAKLGDAIINYMFSVSLTLCFRKPVGIKVRNYVLRKAFKENNLGEKLGMKKMPANVKPEDLVEAITAMLWLEGKIDTEKVIEFMVSNCKNMPYDKAEEIVADMLIKYISSIL